MPKYAQYAEILETRIRRGDYALRELPTEQEFAAEVGVSRTTARRALLQLIDKGMVARKPYGRLIVNERVETLGLLRLALLMPAFASVQYSKWAHATERVAYSHHATVQPLSYAHWDDPAIMHALAKFDGVFLVESSEPMPARVKTLLAQSHNLIALDSDLTALGLPSIRMLCPGFIHQMGDYLLKLGHRHIDLLNSQPGGGLMNELIDQWILWKSLHQVEGQIYNEPVTPHSEPVFGAHQTMTRILDRGEFRATALLCLTGPATTGAIRAFRDHGFKAGQDISIAAVESGDALAKFETPSRTALIMPSPDPYVELCIRWFSGRSGHWNGPLLLQPQSAELFEGESTLRLRPGH